MILTCWSVKGGSGTSVVAAALAVCLAESWPVLAVDLAGDMPSVLGMQVPDGPGVVDWMHAGAGVGGAALTALAVEANPGIRVLPRGRGEIGPAARWSALADVLGTIGSASTASGAVGLATAGDVGVAAAVHLGVSGGLGVGGEVVVVDAGSQAPHAALAAVSTESLLVLRPCFLGLRRASLSAAAPTGVVLIAEPGRSLGRSDVERVTGVRVVGEIPLDPAIARAVDCGLLQVRCPGSLRRSLGQLQRHLTPPPAEVLA